MEQEVIKKDVDLTPEDLYGFQVHLLKKGFKPSVIIMTAMVFSVLLLMALTSDASVLEKAFRAGLVFIVPAAFIAFVFRALKRSSINAFKDNKLVKQTQRYIMSEEAVLVESDTGYSNIKWEDLYKAEEAKENFLLYLSKQQAYVIPKRYFEGQPQQLALMQNLLSKAPKPKQDKKSGQILLWGFLIYLVIFIVILTVILTL